MNKQDWTYKKLGEVCEIICGQDYKKVESPDGKYPIYGTGGIMGFANQFRCPAYSVIIGRKGSINNPLYVEEDFWNVDTAFGIVPSKANLISKYFFYFCKSYDFTKHNVAVTIPSLRRIDLLKIPIPVPPIEEQERIVAELDLLQGIIEKKKEQLKAYDQLAQSIFYTMFGDPIDNPKGWETKKLGEVCDATSSKRIFADEYTSSGIPFYRGKEITEKSKNMPLSIELYISEERYNEIKQNTGIPQIGDILITAVGTIGNIWVVNDDSAFYFKDGNIIWLREIKLQNPIYFRFVLTKLIEAYKQDMVRGAAYNALTIINLKRMPVLLPPLSLQQEFAEKVEAIERQKALVQQSIVETQTMFDCTMDKYFG